MSQPSTRVHVLISGKVQGVGYRYSTFHQAHHLGIRGWVKNLLDGRVEAVFEGSPQAVQAMLRWCHNGPLGAVVNDVAVEYQEPQDLQGFEIRR